MAAHSPWVKILVCTLAACLISSSALLIYVNRKRERRGAVYSAAIAPYRRDLPIGMTKADVGKYLDSRRVSYTAHYWGLRPDAGWSYAIKVAEEPAWRFPCTSWSVYIALDFKSKTPQFARPNEPSDVLTEVHIKKLGNCM